MRGVPFYQPYSDIAIFEVKTMIPRFDKHIDSSTEMLFPICLTPEILPKDVSRVYAVASFGRSTNLKYSNGLNPMNVIERVTYEHNVYIDECPESITRSACRRVIMIEGEKPLYEGSNGGSIIMYVNSWPMLVGVLSARQNVGKAYAKYMFATDLRKFHYSICIYAGICTAGFKNKTLSLSETDAPFFLSLKTSIYNHTYSVIGNGTFTL
ncbi:unnamed protein product [Thelazia callipaeda]|uniref:Peptidase S1 domain-containing protein n=1 Tax=Thelazia callipaeda TaxID=103827 RepID=A0A0N5CQU8_THECL|nr:unnamed protein product [Thelazia callipaeda]